MKDRHIVLLNQLETYRKETVQVLGDVPEEEAEITPIGFRNNIRWNAGHLYMDQYLWLQALTKETQPVPGSFHAWFGFGTSPADFSQDTPSFQELKALLGNQPYRIKEEYGTRLEEDFPAIDMGMQTVEQVLIRTIFHEGMHLQAIMDIKKHLPSRHH